MKETAFSMKWDIFMLYVHKKLKFTLIMDIDFLFSGKRTSGVRAECSFQGRRIWIFHLLEERGAGKAVHSLQFQCLFEDNIMKFIDV